uniref:Immunoglobulin V-set domain-containing protein n=1 Tax=Hucho hucho TaxID=62062 RepID=A0A4W5KDP9_9TELE
VTKQVMYSVENHVPSKLCVSHSTSKVDVRKFVEGPVHQLQCEIHRYSKRMSHHGIWFTCTLWHTASLFTITSFLRVTPATTMFAYQPDFHIWCTIGVKEKLCTSAVMVLMTRSPPVRVGLQKEPTLHCQFAVDHKAPHLTVKWHLQRHGRYRTNLFSYSSSSGQTEGSGVAVKGIARGDASLTVPVTSVSSEGTLTVLGSIQFLNNKSSCTKEYNTLHVEVYLKETSSGQRPEKLENITYYSHHKNNDGTYSLSAFVGLRPSLRSQSAQCIPVECLLARPVHPQDNYRPSFDVFTIILQCRK